MPYYAPGACYWERTRSAGVLMELNGRKSRRFGRRVGDSCCGRRLMRYEGEEGEGGRSDGVVE